MLIARSLCVRCGSKLFRYTKTHSLHNNSMVQVLFIYPCDRRRASHMEVKQFSRDHTESARAGVWIHECSSTVCALYHGTTSLSSCYSSRRIILKIILAFYDSCVPGTLPELVTHSDFLKKWRLGYVNWHGNEENSYVKSVASGASLSGRDGVTRINRGCLNLLDWCLSGGSNVFPRFLAQVVSSVWCWPRSGGMRSLTCVPSLDSVTFPPVRSWSL